jgi:diguanylate cyclase (GGDEF)-like protein
MRVVKIVMKVVGLSLLVAFALVGAFGIRKTFEDRKSLATRQVLDSQQSAYRTQQQAFSKALDARRAELRAIGEALMKDGGTAQTGDWAWVRAKDRSYTQAGQEALVKEGAALARIANDGSLLPRIDYRVESGTIDFHEPIQIKTKAMQESFYVQGSLPAAKFFAAYGAQNLGSAGSRPTVLAVPRDTEAPVSVVYAADGTDTAAFLQSIPETWTREIRRPQVGSTFASRLLEGSTEEASARALGWGRLQEDGTDGRLAVVYLESLPQVNAAVQYAAFGILASIVLLALAVIMRPANKKPSAAEPTMTAPEAAESSAIAVALRTKPSSTRAPTVEAISTAPALASAAHEISTLRQTMADTQKALDEKKREVPLAAGAQDDRDSLLKRILEAPTNEDTAQALESFERPAISPAADRAQGRELAAAVASFYNESFEEISRLSGSLADALNEQEILTRTCQALGRITHGSSVAYLEHRPQERALVVTARSSPEVFAGTQPKTFLPDSDDTRATFARLPMDADFQRFMRDAAALHEHRPQREVPLTDRWHVYPFSMRGQHRGAFVVRDVAACRRPEFASLVEICLQSASTGMENARLHARVTELMIRDPLTELYGRRHFNERLYEQFLVARRLKHPMSLLFIDIDHLKLYEKQFGRSGAEAAIRHVAGIIKKSFRRSDLVARYGNEGFAVLLPHTAVVDAVRKADALCAEVEASIVARADQAGRDLKVTVSVGVGEYPSYTDDPAQILRQAREALHRAQQKSRSQVLMAKGAPHYVPPFASRFVRSSPQAMTPIPTTEEAMDEATASAPQAATAPTKA